MSKSNSFLLIFSVIALIIGVRLEIIELFGSQTPYWDDWGLGGFLTDYKVYGFELERLFRPANEHRITFNRIMSLALFEMNQQQWNPIVWMIANATIWAASGALMVSVINRYAPQPSRVALMVVAITFWVLPFALVNILWGIQTHTYTMVLFSLLGFWWTTNRPFSGKWFAGIFSLAAATLTLAGGTFASVAVIGVSLMLFIATSRTDNSRSNRQQYLKTSIAALLPAVLGFALIAQVAGGSDKELVLTDSITTFLKTMSWPNYKGLWPAFVFAAPVVLLIVQIFKHGEAPSRFTRFVLSIYAFTVIVATGVAYARGLGGPSPAPRYFEFLSLIPLSSLMALCLLSSGRYRVGANTLALMFGGYLLAFGSGLSHQAATVDHVLKEQKKYKALQTLNTSRYLNTGDYAELENQPFRHIPFPHSDIFQAILDKMSAADTLPPSLQPQPDLQWYPEASDEEIQSSAFFRNGTAVLHEEILGSDHLGAPAYGSFNPEMGEEEATGRFESAALRINRSFAQISYMGDISSPDMQLYLEDVGSGDRFYIEPVATPRYAHQYPMTKWLTTQLKLPRGYYKIVAQDNSETGWFAFSSPRPVGRLSYYAQELSSYGHYLWQFAILLLLWSLRHSLIGLFERMRLETYEQPSKEHA